LTVRRASWTLARVKLRHIAALVLVPFAVLAGCSGDDDGNTSGGDGGSGGEIFTGPRGAANMEVYAAEMQTCPPGNIHVDLGSVNSSPPALVLDGRDGGTVSCSVIATGQGYRASGAIQKGAHDWSFSDVITDPGQSATGIVGFKDPASGVVYRSPTAQPCVFQFAPGSGQTIDEGKVFVQFDCGHLVSEANPADECSARYGYVLLEGCSSE
jgi:hypothetical protein